MIGRERPRLRFEGTPEARAIWRSVDVAAGRAPAWLRRRYEKSMSVSTYTFELRDHGEKGLTIFWIQVDDHGQVERQTVARFPRMEQGLAREVFDWLEEKRRREAKEE